MKITFDIHDNRLLALRNFNHAAHIIRLVCQHFKVAVSDLESPSRAWCYVWPRWVAIALIRRHTSLSLSKIGLLFSRDHAAILHAVRGVKKQTDTSPTSRTTLDYLDAAALSVLDLHGASPIKSAA